MKTTVFIPCIPAHYVLLNNVIDCILAGTVMPDEIVVVLSDATKVNQEYIDILTRMYTTYINLKDFRFLVHQVPVLLYTGEACNLIKDYCTGDIVIIQAADDIPHPRRVEIIKKYFEQYDIVSLNHSFYGLSEIVYYGMEKLLHMADERLNNIKVVQPHRIKSHVESCPHDVYGQNCGFKVAAGTVAYRREIARDVKWSQAPKGQDTIFCKDVILKYNKSIIIDAPLYFYFK